MQLEGLGKLKKKSISSDKADKLAISEPIA
jgi:hypothetical protein